MNFSSIWNFIHQSFINNFFITSIIVFLLICSLCGLFYVIIEKGQEEIKTVMIKGVILATIGFLFFMFIILVDEINQNAIMRVII
jgi:hypothetical protein